MSASPHPRARPSIDRLARLAGLAAGLVLLPGAPAQGSALPGVQPPEAQPPSAPAPGAPPPAQPETDIYEGRVIRQVVLQKPVPPSPEQPQVQRYEPLAPEIEGLARRQLRAIEGTPYIQATVTGDVGRLNRIGRFGHIENRVQMLDDGSLVLVYTLTPQPVVRSVQSVGNRRISDQDIAREVEGLVGTPVDRYRLDQACRRIEQLYREKGYYFAKVTVEDKELEAAGAVLFRVREGERLKVTDIRFEGNKSFSPKELRSVINTREAWLLDKGILEDETLENDVAAIVGYYKDRGYLDVRASRLVRPAPNGREAIVTFLVEEGPIYTLREVKVYYPDNARKFDTLEEAMAALKPGQRVLPIAAGAFAVYELGPFTPEQMLGLMELKPGGVYSQDRLRVSMQTLRDAFGKLGYSDVRMQRLELRDPDRPLVDILIEVSPGQPFKIGEVIIKGNELTRDRVIRRNITLKPGRPADTTQTDETKRRLQDTRLFARPSLDNPQPVKVTLQPPDPLDATYRDLLVEVTETNTGEFSIGAAVSSDAGVVGRLALKQRNFDITDTPDSFGEFLSGKAFRGGGQTFSIDLQPGDRIETYAVSLQEPSLFDTDLIGSGTLAYRSRDFDEFDESRAGGRLGIGRRFGTRWTGNIPLRIEAIDISNISPERPTDVFDSQGESTITSLGLSLTRTSLDHQLRPTRGTRLEFSLDQAGALGGDYSFTTLRAEHAVFIPIYEDFLGVRTVLSFNTRVGYIPQGRDSVPVFERFYLGGQSFRGFDFRGVSPRGVAQDTGLPSFDPIGGTWMFFWGAEIRQPVFEDTVSVVGFVDTGTVTFDPGFDSYRVSAGMGIRLYVPALSPVPLAFDFGFPLVQEEHDAERAFSFSLDVPF